MSSATDISTLYREFADALRDVLAENAVGLASRGRLARTRAAGARNTPIIASMDIFWRSKWHLNNGKPCKTSVHHKRPPTARRAYAEREITETDTMSGMSALGRKDRGSKNPRLPKRATRRGTTTG